MFVSFSSYVLGRFMLFILLLCRFCFFFFQAEDGIRDDLVTGVQTCALPISYIGRLLDETHCAEDQDERGCGRRSENRRFVPGNARQFAPAQPMAPLDALAEAMCIDMRDRSEERRVGKECRSWSAAGQTKKER